MCKVWYKLVNFPGRSEKVGLQHFANLREKKEAEVGVAYITRFSRIQGTFGFFECGTNYMAIISQNALSLIIAPPSRHWKNNRDLAGFPARALITISHYQEN